METKQQQKCGTCKYFRAGEKVKWVLPDGRVETEELDPLWRNHGACVANPLIRPLPEVWWYDDMRRLRTFWNTKRRGKTCLRWDDGGRDLITIEIEQEVAVALEKAADELGVSTSALVMRLLEGKKLWRQDKAKRRDASENKQSGEESPNETSLAGKCENPSSGRTRKEPKKRRKSAPTLMIDGSLCLGSGGTWALGCEEWKEATLVQKPTGQLELVLDHFVSGEREPIFHNVLLGDEEMLLDGAKRVYGDVPDFVVEVFRLAGTEVCNKSSINSDQ